MTELHRDAGTASPVCRSVLNAAPADRPSQDVLHDWSLMVALDGLIDDGAKLDGP